MKLLIYSSESIRIIHGVYAHRMLWMEWVIKNTHTNENNDQPAIIFSIQSTAHKVLRQNWSPFSIFCRFFFQTQIGYCPMPATYLHTLRVAWENLFSFSSLLCRSIYPSPLFVYFNICKMDWEGRRVKQMKTYAKNDDINCKSGLSCILLHLLFFTMSSLV